jgi:hypothetical protein
MNTPRAINPSSDRLRTQPRWRRSLSVCLRDIFAFCSLAGVFCVLVHERAQGSSGTGRCGSSSTPPKGRKRRRMASAKSTSGFLSSPRVAVKMDRSSSSTEQPLRARASAGAPRPPGRHCGSSELRSMSLVNGHVARSACLFFPCEARTTLACGTQAAGRTDNHTACRSR